MVSGLSSAVVDWAPHVDWLLSVQHHVQPHQRAGPGGGPEALQAPRHVGVEGKTISIPRAEVNLKVAEENNNYRQSKADWSTSMSRTFPRNSYASSLMPQRTRGFGTKNTHWGVFCLLLAGSLLHKGAYNRTFPCMKAIYPCAIKNQRGVSY